MATLQMPVSPEKHRDLMNIPLVCISPNPLNPRKAIDAASLKELAESIRAHGVQQPVLVRPNGGMGKYQLVVGERRLRASKLAGCQDIPAIVDLDLTDSQVLEIMIVENLQRQDVHPLDEALGYAQLLKIEDLAKPVTTVEDISGKVGKSTSYVYQRLKLAELVPKAQKEFRERFLTAAHAIDIARLQPDDQHRALAWCHEPEFGRSRDTAPAFRELRKWIQENIQLNLDKAPFDIRDPKLVPSAGACTECPKRSGSNPALFEGMGKNTCTDPGCYQAKKMALVNIHVDRIEGKAGVKPILISADYYPDNGRKQKGVLYGDSYKLDYYSKGKFVPIAPNSCTAARLAVFIDGPKTGKQVWVCLAKRGCKEHSDLTSSHNGADSALARRRQRIARHFSTETFKALAEKLADKKHSQAGMHRDDLELVCLEFFGKLGHYSETPMIAALGWDKKLGQWNAGGALRKKFDGMTTAELFAHLVLFAVAPNLNSSTERDSKDLTAVARRHGINTAKLLEASRTKFAKKKKAAKK